MKVLDQGWQNTALDQAEVTDLGDLTGGFGYHVSLGNRRGL